MTTMTDLFKKSKQEWLTDTREYAMQLSDGYKVITIEDVLVAKPLPDYLHHNTIGSLFNRKDFKHVGYTTSKRRVSHGRVISQWVSKGSFALPENWNECSKQASDDSNVSVID